MRNSDSTQVVRLDVALLERGLTDSRSKAQRLIADGKVSVNGVTVTKASAKVGGDDVIAADRGDGYVSRGAYKLVGAFERFADVGLRSAQGLRCLDIGASTGGFCDVLLRNDAAQVIALDVGHGQLDPKIAHDDRIIEMSGVNIRDVYAEDLPYRPEMICFRTYRLFADICDSGDRKNRRTAGADRAAGQTTVRGRQRQPWEKRDCRKPGITRTGAVLRRGMRGTQRA